MSDLKCSVVVPTYNRVGLLRHTLQSLANQTLPAGEFEVLVVDDGSSDSTATMITEFTDRLDLRYFFLPDEGYRAARARNVGIANARNEICVLVDSGVLLHSGCLAAHLANHVRSAEPVAVNGYVYCFNMDNADAELIGRTINFEHPDETMDRLAATRQWMDLRESFYEMYTDDFNHIPAPWLMYWTCNVSARTAQLRQIGMFDEWFRTWGGEDVDLAYRLHRAGAHFLVDRAASSIHCPHDKSFDDSMESVAGNYEYIATKYGTPITRLLTEMPDPVTIFNFSEVIRERGLPGCAEYLAGRASLA